MDCSFVVPLHVVTRRSPLQACTLHATCAHRTQHVATCFTKRELCNICALAILQDSRRPVLHGILTVPIVLHADAVCTATGKAAGCLQAPIWHTARLAYASSTQVVVSWGCYTHHSRPPSAFCKACWVQCGVRHLLCSWRPLVQRTCGATRPLGFIVHWGPGRAMACAVHSHTLSPLDSCRA
jgi:hypothetical protein